MTAPSAVLMILVVLLFCGVVDGDALSVLLSLLLMAVVGGDCVTESV